MKKSVEFLLSEKSDVLYIFFGGIASGIAIPPFEFYNSSKIIEENKIFIRDFEQSWYQGGVSGFSFDVMSTLCFIEKQIESINPKKVFFVGNSMGGFAAILFSVLSGRGEAIAFSPQSFISPILRLRFRDFRWCNQVFKVYMKGFKKEKFWDLRSVLLKNGVKKKISIFVSSDYRLDYVHADRLKNIPNVSVFKFQGGGHDVVRLLKKKGALPEIMSGNYRC